MQEEHSEINERELLNKRSQQLIKFFSKRPSLAGFFLMLVTLFVGVIIRIQNLPLLKDITTNKYIPLALDPFVFLRYAEYIATHGSLFLVDKMRYYPLGSDVTHLTTFTSFFVVYLYKILSFFIPEITLQKVDVIYPVIAFVLFALFFYLLIKRLFNWKVALVSTLFITLLPTFLYRTMCGFSDHDVLSMVFWMASFYAFVIGWQSKKTWVAVLMGFLSGVLVGYHGLTAGNVKFSLIIIGTFALIEILFNKFSKKDFYQYSIWTVTSFVILAFLTKRYNGLIGLATSFTSGIALLAFLAGLVDYFIFKLDILKIKKKITGKYPLGLVSFAVVFVLAFLGAIIALGPSFLIDQLTHIYQSLLFALGTTRWALTVAENHQPFFTDWIAQLTWVYLLLFMGGSIWLFYEMLSHTRKKIQIQSTILYTIFLAALVLSRYSSKSIFDGLSFISKVVYIGGMVLFIGYMVFGYLYAFYKDKELYEHIKAIDKKYIFIFIWFFLMVIAARTASRLLFEFSPITAIMAAYFIIESISWATSSSRNPNQKITGLALAAFIVFYVLVNKLPFSGIFIVLALLLASLLFIKPKKITKDTKKYILTSLIILGLLSISTVFALSSYYQAQHTGPSYNHQWQTAMKWVRNNTPKDSVFIHWWDYGYWVQYGGKRATVTDGGNQIVLWNYYIGRHLLTAQNQTEALELTKTYGADYLLIISDDIGKYTAYSSIGSDIHYDRYAWITTFTMDPTQTVETRNQTIYLYRGVHVLDDDFIYKGRVFPAEQSAVAAVFVPMSQIKYTLGNQTIKLDKFSQPTLAIIYNNQRTDVPLSCIYYNNQIHFFPKPGYNGCLRIMPRITNNGYNPMGGAVFISEEVMKGLMANLYLLNQKNPNWNSSAFTLVHSEQHPALIELNNKYNLGINDLAMYGNSVIGPIKIWKINAPANIKTNPKYLLTSFKEANLTAVQKVKGRDY